MAGVESGKMAKEVPQNQCAEFSAENEDGGRTLMTAYHCHDFGRDNGIGTTFAALNRANGLRLPTFKNKQGEIAHPSGTVDDWTLSQWSNAAAGEMGEACNIVKKLERGDFGPVDQISTRKMREILGHEIADVVIYLDLLCQRAGISLSEAVQEKFNRTSAQQELNVFLFANVVYTGELSRLKYRDFLNGIYEPLTLPEK